MRLRTQSQRYPFRLDLECQPRWTEDRNRLLPEAKFDFVVSVPEKKVSKPRVAIGPSSQGGLVGNCKLPMPLVIARSKGERAVASHSSRGDINEAGGP